jgi:hypothetical protein
VPHLIVYHLPQGKKYLGRDKTESRRHLAARFPSEEAANARILRLMEIAQREPGLARLVEVARVEKA